MENEIEITFFVAHTIMSELSNMQWKKILILFKLSSFISKFLITNVELFWSHITVIKQYIFSPFFSFSFSFFALFLLILSSYSLTQSPSHWHRYSIIYSLSLSYPLFHTCLESLHFTLFLCSIIIIKCREMRRKFPCSWYWCFFVFGRYRLRIEYEKHLFRQPFHKRRSGKAWNWKLWKYIQ